MDENDPFFLNNLWIHYLKLAGLTEAMLPETQCREMKKAFYGGMGELIVLMQEKVAVLGEEAGAKQMQDFMEQIDSFWQAQVALKKLRDRNNAKRGFN